MLNYNYIVVLVRVENKFYPVLRKRFWRQTLTSILKTGFFYFNNMENIKFVCQYNKCGKVFYSTNPKRRYCGRSCAGFVHGKTGGLAMSQKLIERNKSPEFIEKVKAGLKRHYAKNSRKKESWYIKRYGKDYKPLSLKHCHGWKETSKKLREKYNCHRCNSTNYLDVHHIIPYSISQDNSLLNLIVLCRGCHKTVEHNNLMFMELINDWYVLRDIFRLSYEDKGRGISYAI